MTSYQVVRNFIMGRLKVQIVVENCWWYRLVLEVESDLHVELAPSLLLQSEWIRGHLCCWSGSVWIRIAIDEMRLQMIKADPGKNGLLLTSNRLVESNVEDILHIVDIRQRLLLAVGIDTHERHLPFAHWVAMLLLSLDDVLVRDDL